MLSKLGLRKSTASGLNSSGGGGSKPNLTGSKSSLSGSKSNVTGSNPELPTRSTTGSGTISKWASAMMHTSIRHAEEELKGESVGNDNNKSGNEDGRDNDKRNNGSKASLRAKAASREALNQGSGNKSEAAGSRADVRDGEEARRVSDDHLRDDDYAPAPISEPAAEGAARGSRKSLQAIKPSTSRDALNASTSKSNIANVEGDRTRGSTNSVAGGSTSLLDHPRNASQSQSQIQRGSRPDMAAGRSVRSVRDAGTYDDDAFEPELQPERVASVGGSQNQLTSQQALNRKEREAVEPEREEQPQRVVSVRGSQARLNSQPALNRNDEYDQERFEDSGSVRPAESQAASRQDVRPGASRPDVAGQTQSRSQSQHLQQDQQAYGDEEFEDFGAGGTGPAGTGSRATLPIGSTATLARSQQPLNDTVGRSQADMRAAPSRSKVVGSYGNVAGSRANVAASHANVAGSQANVAGSRANVTGNQANVAGSRANLAASQANVVDSAQAGSRDNLKASRQELNSEQRHHKSAANIPAGSRENLSGSRQGLRDAEQHHRSAANVPVGSQANLRASRQALRADEPQRSGSRDNLRQQTGSQENLRSPRQAPRDEEQHQPGTRDNLRGSRQALQSEERQKSDSQDNMRSSRPALGGSDDKLRGRSQQALASGAGSRSVSRDNLRGKSQHQLVNDGGATGSRSASRDNLHGISQQQLHNTGGAGSRSVSRDNLRGRSQQRLATADAGAGSRSVSRDNLRNSQQQLQNDEPKHTKDENRPDDTRGPISRPESRHSLRAAGDEYTNNQSGYNEDEFEDFESGRVDGRKSQMHINHQDVAGSRNALVAGEITSPQIVRGSRNVLATDKWEASRQDVRGSYNALAGGKSQVVSRQDLMGSQRLDNNAAASSSPKQSRADVRGSRNTLEGSSNAIAAAGSRGDVRGSQNMAGSQQHLSRGIAEGNKASSRQKLGGEGQTTSRNDMRGSQNVAAANDVRGSQHVGAANASLSQSRSHLSKQSVGGQEPTAQGVSDQSAYAGDAYDDDPGFEQGGTAAQSEANLRRGSNTDGTESTHPSRAHLNDANLPANSRHEVHEALDALSAAKKKSAHNSTKSVAASGRDLHAPLDALAAALGGGSGRHSKGASKGDVRSRGGSRQLLAQSQNISSNDANGDANGYEDDFVGSGHVGPEGAASVTASQHASREQLGKQASKSQAASRKDIRGEGSTSSKTALQDAAGTSHAASRPNLASQRSREVSTGRSHTPSYNDVRGYSANDFEEDRDTQRDDAEGEGYADDFESQAVSRTHLNDTPAKSQAASHNNVRAASASSNQNQPSAAKGSQDVLTDQQAKSRAASRKNVSGSRNALANDNGRHKSNAASQDFGYTMDAFDDDNAAQVPVDVGLAREASRHSSRAASANQLDQNRHDSDAYAIRPRTATDDDYGYSMDAFDEPANIREQANYVGQQQGPGSNNSSRRESRRGSAHQSADWQLPPIPSSQTPQRRPSSRAVDAEIDEGYFHVSSTSGSKQHLANDHVASHTSLKAKSKSLLNSIANMVHPHHHSNTNTAGPRTGDREPDEESRLYSNRSPSVDKSPKVQRKEKKPGHKQSGTGALPSLPPKGRANVQQQEHQKPHAHRQDVPDAATAPLIAQLRYQIASLKEQLGERDHAIDLLRAREAELRSAHSGGTTKSSHKIDESTRILLDRQKKAYQLQVQKLRREVRRLQFQRGSLADPLIELTYFPGLSRAKQEAAGRNLTNGGAGVDDFSMNPPPATGNHPESGSRWWWGSGPQLSGHLGQQRPQTAPHTPSYRNDDSLDAHPSSKTNASAYPPIKEGERVNVNIKGETCAGVVQFVGQLQGHPETGLWCGIGLDRPVGKHDGLVQGNRYFSCPPAHGLFVKANKVAKAAS